VTDVRGPTLALVETRPALYKYSIVTCARWEEADLSEWIEYHRSIGFSHIYLYSNDNDPLPTLKAILPFVFGENPFVTFKHFPKRTERPQQQSIYYHFLQHYKNETEWFSFLDADEFFVLRGVDNISRFMLPFENHYDAVYFNWVIYGHMGKEVRDYDSVLLSHTRRAPRPDVHTKILARSSLVDVDRMRDQYIYPRPGFWHFLDQYDLGPARLANVLHDSMGAYGDEFPKKAHALLSAPGKAERIISKGYIAHFQFKSAADFQRRIDRGGSFTVPYWTGILAGGSHKDFLKRGNAVEDPYLARYWLGIAKQAYDILLPERSEPSADKNVALRKPSDQSSVRERQSDDPLGSHRQGHGNNGVRTGSFGFATFVETNPWWKVNLADEFILTELRIYGQQGSDLWRPGKSRLQVEVSLDGTVWQCLSSDVSVLGDEVGPSATVSIENLVVGRFLRVTLFGEGSLHFDELELCGRSA
jgi:hypothetical protein